MKSVKKSSDEFLEQTCVKGLEFTSLVFDLYYSSDLADGVGEMASSMTAVLKAGVVAVDYCVGMSWRTYACAREAGSAVPIQAGRF